jgi:hypothetical protein
VNETATGISFARGPGDADGLLRRGHGDGAHHVGFAVAKRLDLRGVTALRLRGRHSRIGLVADAAFPCGSKVRAEIALELFPARLVLDEREGREIRQVQTLEKNQARFESAVGQENVIRELRQRVPIQWHDPILV